LPTRRFPARGVGLMLAATVAIVAELAAARRLVYVPAGKGLPAGAVLPHLFLRQFH
jgi:hypothetical protein